MIRRDSHCLYPAQPQRDRWMISYLDMVTILLVFFVAAAAKTLAPAPKPQPVPPIAIAPPIIRPSAPPPSELQEKLAAAGIEVRRESRGLVASLPQTVLFSPGDDRIAVTAMPLLENIAQVLRQVPNQVIVVGHADSAPVHNRRFGSNWELSTARGMRVLELLAQQYQIDERRLSVSGDGSTRPAGDNSTPEGRAANRRVELVILDAPITNPAPSAD